MKLIRKTEKLRFWEADCLARYIIKLNFMEKALEMGSGIEQASEIMFDNVESFINANKEIFALKKI